MVRKSRLFIGLIMFMVFCFSFIMTVQAQDNWTAMPPYNTLWPLWSTALSPIDAVSGLPTPVVTSLAPKTVLPVQPGLTWNPSLEYPWLLYNTPVGMAYFDPYYGVDFWPAPSLVDATGSALPIELPVDYNLLPPTAPLWLQQNVLFSNLYFLRAYPGLLAAADPATLIAASTIPLPPSIVGALTLGLPIPALGVTLFPPPAINTFLTPAGILGW